MASPRKKDSERFRIYTSQRSGFEFGFQPITERPNAYWREAGKPVQDVNIQVSPNEFDQPPPSTQPLGGKDISGSARANSDFTNSNAQIQPTSLVTYITPGTIDSNTVLLLHMDGINGSTSFPDSEFIQKTVTANSGAIVSTTQSKFGGGSCFFNGSTSFLSTPDSNDWNFGAGDFTVDFWVYVNTLGVQQAYVAQDVTEILTKGWRLYIDTLDRLFLRFDNSGSPIANYRCTPTLSIGNFFHFAFVRSNTGAFIFVNGSSQAVTQLTAFGTKTMPDYAAPLTIGARVSVDNPQIITEPFNGYIDEVRVSSIARWVSGFTPPTSAYSDSSPTLPIATNQPLLIGGSGQNVTLSLNPQVVQGREAQACTIQCVGSNVTLLNGRGLTLNTPQYLMTSGSLLNLFYSATDNTWHETSRGQLFGDLGQF